MNFKTSLAVLAMGSSSLALAAPAHAQSAEGTDRTGIATEAPNKKTASDPSTAQISDIIVTARKIAEPLSKAPVAVTAFTQEQLRQREIRQPQDLNVATPSLTVSSGTSSDARGGRDVASYNVRGLSVGGAVYFAGAPGGAGAQQFYDLANIQVVNGPQGTLFGRTSTGGAILFEPNRPDFDFDGFGQIGVGNYSFRRFDGMVNVPLIDDVLAVRLSGLVLRRDGYVRSLDTGQDLDDQHRESVRLGVTFNPFGDTLKTYTMLQYNNINENGAGQIVRDFSPGFLLGGALPIYQQGFFDSLIPGLPFPLTFGQATFGGVCAQEAARAGVAGNQAFINGCATQRGNILANIGQQYTTAAARTAAGGVRLANNSEPNAFKDRRVTILNNSVLGLGGEGLFSNLTVKNVFSYSTNFKRPSTFNDLDGIASAQLDLQAGQPSAVLGTCETTGVNIGFCSRPTQSRAVGFPTTNQLSEEINVSATVFGHLDLLGGYFLFNDKTKPSLGFYYGALGNVFNVGLAPGLPSKSGGRENRERGAFISGTLDLSNWLLEGLKVSAGYRHTRTSTVFSDETVAGTGVFATTRSSDKGGSRTFTINWQANKDILLYARSGTGFQPGGVNGCANFSSSAGLICPATFKKQSATDYEIGTKLGWLVAGVRARTEAAIYQTDFTDIQKAQFLLSDSNIVYNPIVNSAKARIRGFEITQSFSYEGFTLSGNVSYTDAKYTRDFEHTTSNVCTDPFNNSNNDCADLSGSPLPGAAKRKFGLLASWALPLADDVGKITPSVQASYVSRVHYGQEVLNPNSSASGYWLVNARLDWNNVMGFPVDIAAFGRNVFNKTYVTAVLPLQADTLFGFNTVQYGEPSMYGLEIRYRFGKGSRR